MSTSRSVSSDSSFRTTTYDLGDAVAEVMDRFAPMDIETELRRLIDPKAAVRTVHWGRNYLYEANHEVKRSGSRFFGGVSIRMNRPRPAEKEDDDKEEAKIIS